MQQLSEHQRTLLSALRDGELKGEELQQAERLVADSEAARAFLGELELLHGVALEAWAAPIAAGSIPASLSAEVIRAAAVARGTAAHGLLGSAWGVGGVIAAAAAVVIGVTMSLNTGPDSPRVDSRLASVPSAPAIQPDPVVRTVSLDADDLIVPQMTSEELVGFAVDGVVPIDAKRDRYASVASAGGDSIALRMRTRPASVIDASALGIDALAGLDSLHGAVRTTLVRCGADGLAVRSDLPELRLRLLRRIEQAATQIPDDFRRRIERAREELMRLQQRMVVHPAAATAGVEAPVRYFIVNRSPFDATPGIAPGPFVFAVSVRNTVEVSPTVIARLAPPAMPMLVIHRSLPAPTVAVAAHDLIAPDPDVSTPVPSTSTHASSANGRADASDARDANRNLAVPPGQPPIDDLLERAAAALDRAEHNLHEAEGKIERQRFRLQLERTIRLNDDRPTSTDSDSGATSSGDPTGTTNDGGR